MATITINGKVCEFEGSPSIMTVADANGIEIPRYCYHEGLSVTASCRICLVEVWAPNPRNDNKVELIPRLFPSCQTPAGDGQLVYSNSEKAVDNQKAVMEYLLINHPLDCPVCDQAGECHLQDYSFKFGRCESRFEEDKIKQRKKDLGETVWLYSDRCIMCTRCVRFTDEITHTNELCVIGRGSNEQIDLFPGRPLDNPMMGNVVDVCPVGAMLDKDFQFQQRVWFLTGTPSIDGTTSGGDNIFIYHNEGQIYRIKPRKNMATNKWWISDEVRYGWKFVHCEDRLAQPTREQHGEQVPITFDHAYHEIDEQLNAIVREGGTIAAMISPMLSCEEAYLIGQYVRQHHDNPADAVLGLGPVPMEGEDQTFPPTAKADDANAYTIRAEKAPNARGVQRVLNGFAQLDKADQSGSLDFDGFIAAVKKAKAVILTGNYPSEWMTKELTKALSKKLVILIDTLPNAWTPKATFVLPASTWMEKSGTFENVNSLLQAFERSIQPIEGTRPEGQILTDLMAIADGLPLSHSPRFSAESVRSAMANTLHMQEFETDVSIPTGGGVICEDEYEMALTTI